MRRFICLLFSFVLVLCCVGLKAKAAENSGACGDNLTWSFEEATGTLTISGMGEMDNYTWYTNKNSSAYAPWCVNGYRLKIRAVVIESGVTSIGDWAFDDCTSLTRVTLPDGLTSIGAYAFSACLSLTNVKIPDSVTNIGSCAFMDCTALTNVTIPGSVTSIGGEAFSCCDALASVTIGEGVNDIGFWAFFSCDALTSVTIPGSVTSIGEEAFYGCDALSRLIICEGVTSIGDGAFSYCEMLTNITIPGSVTSIGKDAFSNCDALASVILCEGVTSIGDGAFFDCDGLTTVTIPDGLTIIGGDAFHSCEGLTNITFPDSVTSIGNEAFAGCSLESVIIHEGLKSLGDGAFFFCRKLTSVTIPSSLASIGNEAFSECAAMKDVFYAGTPEQREQIKIGYDNDSLLSAKWHYGTVYEHIYTSAVTAPTCTEAGYTTYTCSVCGYSYIGNEVSATGHSYTSTVTAQTCTESGYTTYTCHCGDSYTGDETAATGHSFGEWVQTKAPTTTTSGEERRDCENCNRYQTRTVAALHLTAPQIKASADTVTGKTKLSWKAVPGADFYRVYRAASITGKYVYLKSTRSTSLTDTTAVTGKNYYYKVCAVVEETEDVSAFSNIVNRCCDLAKPEVILTVKTATGKPVVKWGTVDGASKYRVYRSTSKSSGYTLVYTTAVYRSYTDTTAKAGTNYYYKVKAIHTNSSADSAYSEVVNRVCDLAKPVVTITLKDGDPRLTWDKISGAEKYYVYRATSKDGEYTKVKTTVTASSFTDTTAKVGTKYYYKVKAIHSNSAANSAWSSINYITAK